MHMGTCMQYSGDSDATLCIMAANTVLNSFGAFDLNFAKTKFFYQCNCDVAV